MSEETKVVSETKVVVKDNFGIRAKRFFKNHWKGLVIGATSAAGAAGLTWLGTKRFGGSEDFEYGSYPAEPSSGWQDDVSTFASNEEGEQ